MDKEDYNKFKKFINIFKICSRYRFFVGIGQMFDFQDVRFSIDKHDSEWKCLGKTKIKLEQDDE